MSSSVELSLFLLLARDNPNKLGSPLARSSVRYLTQKKRGIVSLSIPRIEALALPIVVEQTTFEPTPI